MTPNSKGHDLFNNEREVESELDTQSKNPYGMGQLDDCQSVHNDDTTIDDDLKDLADLMKPPEKEGPNIDAGMAKVINESSMIKFLELAYRNCRTNIKNQKTVQNC